MDTSVGGCDLRNFLLFGEIPLEDNGPHQQNQKTLLLMRHAKSDWDHPDQPDHKRPLNDRGREAADRMATWIAREAGIPDVVLCSSARRTRETVERMLAIWFSSTEVMYSDELYHATPVQILHQIEEDGLEAVRLLVLGHNPGMEQLVSSLSGKTIAFPSAAVAVFKLPEATDWKKFRSADQVTLLRLAKPKELD